MSTTPKYGLPYPTETDDADIPLDMGELATTLDDVMLGRTLVDAKGDLLAGSGADTVTRVPVGADGRVLTADSAAAGGISWQPGPAGSYVPVSLVDAKGDVLVGQADNTLARLPVGADTQVLTADAAQALGVRWATPTGGAGGAVAIGTTLPAAPTDGQEAILVDSLTVPTYSWRFRYTASITSAYKWLFVGGTAAQHRIDTGEATASTAYVDLATVGPTLTLPRDGDYEVWYAMQATNSAVSTSGMQLSISGTPDGPSLIAADIRTAGQYLQAQRLLRISGITGSRVVKMQYAVGSGTGTFLRRDLSIRPVRVA